jgi:hypothetical protein
MRQAVFVLTLSLLIALPAAAAETVDAVWKERKIDFRFFGLDVAYSCEAVEAKITMLLKHVGAEDIHVRVPTFVGFNGPQRQHRVFAEFSTLARAAEGDLDIVETVISRSLASESKAKQSASTDGGRVAWRVIRWRSWLVNSQLSTRR